MTDFLVPIHVIGELISKFGIAVIRQFEIIGPVLFKEKMTECGII